MGIKISSVKSSYPLSEVLAEQGYSLVPKPNTPLEQLFKYSSDAEYRKDMNLDEYAQNVFNVSTVPAGVSGASVLDNPTLHSVTMDNMVEILAKSIKKHLVFARTVVKPLVGSYYERVVEDLSKATIPSPSEQFEIRCMELPDLVNDVAYMSQFDRYKDKHYRLDDNSPYNMAHIPLEIIERYIDSANVEVNQSLHALLTTLPSDYLKNIWDGFFTHSDSHTAILPSMVASMNAYDKLYVGLFLYQMCDNLYEPTDEAITGMTLREWQDRIIELKDYAGSLVANNYYQIEQLDTQGFMILSVNSSKKYCLVSGKLYNAWIKEDNSPEVLFGLIVSDKGLITVNSINDAKEELLKEWNLYYNVNLARFSVEKLALFKRLLVERFYLFMKDTDSDEVDYRSDHPKYHEIVRHKLDTVIESLSNKDMDDIFIICLKLIAQCRFYYTSAYDILNGVNNAIEVNPNISVRDAALISTIEYIGDYLSAQIDRKV
jgi:hypothetical protein